MNRIKCEVRVDETGKYKSQDCTFMSYVNMHGRLKSLDLLVVSLYQHTTRITGSFDGVSDSLSGR